MSNIKIGNFYYGKVYSKYNNHLYSDKTFKIRPILVIGKNNNNFYKCLGLTSQLKDGKNITNTRLDYLINNRHSQIICDKIILINKNNIYDFITECNNEDFDYILNRVKEYQ